MALATLEDVTATVGGASHAVSLTLSEEGLVVGRFGTLPWEGSVLSLEVAADGCRLRLAPPGGVSAEFFVPVSSFATFGGARAMKTFAAWLLRSAVELGATAARAAA